MKKYLVLCLLFLVFILCLTACAMPEENTDDGKLEIISTIFPTYDFARQICGDVAEVSMLLPPGSESHSYEPTAQDVIAIQNCDLFLYTGGESDTWVEEILDSMDTPVLSLRMMDCVNVMEEELVAGMQAEDEADEKEYDEHVWTSPKNAILIVRGILDLLSEIAPEYSQTFSANAESYVTQLTQLDQDFTDFFAGVTNKMLLFGDRFPLRYFADAYGLTYYAAFPGCNMETEPSAATIAFLIDKVKEEKISTVFYIEFSNHRVADSIAEATKTRTALFHCCHNVSKEELEAGATYLSLMRQNLETLKGAME